MDINFRHNSSQVLFRPAEFVTSSLLFLTLAQQFTGKIMIVRSGFIPRSSATNTCTERTPKTKSFIEYYCIPRSSAAIGFLIFLSFLLFSSIFSIFLFYYSFYFFRIYLLSSRVNSLSFAVLTDRFVRTNNFNSSASHICSNIISGFSRYSYYS